MYTQGGYLYSTYYLLSICQSYNTNLQLEGDSRHVGGISQVHSQVQCHCATCAWHSRTLSRRRRPAWLLTSFFSCWVCELWNDQKAEIWSDSESGWAPSRVVILLLHMIIYSTVSGAECRQTARQRSLSNIRTACICVCVQHMYGIVRVCTYRVRVQ